MNTFNVVPASILHLVGNIISLNLADISSKSKINNKSLLFFRFMPPDDPLGRHGPSLDNFLRKKPLPTDQKRQLCPYGEMLLASFCYNIFLYCTVSFNNVFFHPFWFSSDKKCTYGIKCKFYHPERTNQSYLSLADELREKAQISTVKDRNARSSPRQLQSDSGSAHNACYYPQDSNTELIRNQKSSSYPGQVSENKLLYWDDPRNSQNQACSATESLHLMPSHYYANISHECLDSGLGSFESLYSGTSHCLSNSHRLGPQRQNALPGPRQISVHLENKTTSQSCTCCSHAAPSAAHQQPQRNLDSKVQASYPPHVYLPNVPHQHIIPSHLHYTGAHHHQQNYWSDPFLGLPQARTCSLSSSVHSSHSHNSYCSSKSHQYHSWGQPQSPSAASDPQRLELRKKLQAIFNPHQVDAVMEMFPHLMDAQKLAAEILNLKTQGGIF